MSTPTVPRGSRSSQGQGRVRGTGITRGNGIAPSKKNAHPSHTPASSSPKPAPLPSLKTPPNNARAEPKTWRKGRATRGRDQSSRSPSRGDRQSIALTGAATSPLPRGFQFLNTPSQHKTRRDPGSMTTDVYQKHMSEIFIKVRVPSFIADFRGSYSDFLVFFRCHSSRETEKKKDKMQSEMDISRIPRSQRA